MKLAIVADLHGNVPALRAMEKTLRGLAVDGIWFLGDAVGKGPGSIECCDWARENCAVCVGGNWDYGIGEKAYPEDVYWWGRLGEDRLRWLRELPREARLTISGRHFRLFHGRPVHRFIHPDDDEALMTPAFTDEQGVTHDGVIFADVHRPFIRALHSGYIINTGSVGNSLGVTAAHALLLEGTVNSETPAPLLMTILSVPYDREQAIADCPPELPHREEYIEELLTGHYARGQKPEA